MPVEFEVARVDRSIKEPDDEPDYPVIHCFGYTEDGSPEHARITGFEPYFYAPYEEVDDVTVDGHPHIKRIEVYDDDGEPFQSVRRERVAKVVTHVPGDVPDAREDFSNSWESDVLFSQRFITDLDVGSGLRVPTTDEPVDVSSVETFYANYDWRIHYMDIEVDDRSGFPENGEQPIICITAYDNFENEYITWLWGEGEDEGYSEHSELHDAPASVRWFDDEVSMLVDYISYVSGSNPSIITGWNSNDFDLPYFMDRCEVLTDELQSGDRDHRVDEVPYRAMSPMFRASHSDYWGVRVKGVSCFDLLDGFAEMQFSELDSYRLEAVADAVVGETKEQYVGTIGNLWEDDPVKLVDYNLRDVELLVEINRRQEVIAFWKEVKSLGHCQLTDAPTESTVADRYILNEYHGDVVFPRQGSQEEADEGYAGGAVFDPITGIIENVPTLDLKSLYPMSMLTLNASPETKVDPAAYDGETIQSPNGIHFRTDQQGLTRKVIEDLLERREAKKAERDAEDPDSEQYDIYDRQQRALKVIMNTLYGVMAWSRFRLYDQDVASAVTATGRAVLQHTAGVCEDMGHPVAYGDTDSVLLDLDDTLDRDETISLCFDIEEAINESYDEWAEAELDATEHWFEIEFEKLYKRYFQAGSKKRYAGHIVWKEGKDVDDVDITGFQYKRSDCSKKGKEVQKESINRIVHGAPKEDVLEYVKSELDAFDNRDVLLDDIGIPEGIGSDLNDYTADTHPVRGAKMGNLLLGTTFASGSKPKRYYLDDVHPALFERLEQEEGFDPGRDRVYADFKRNSWVIAVDRPEELAGELVFDWEGMRRKNIKEVMTGIMLALGYDWDDVLADSHQTGLDAFA